MALAANIVGLAGVALVVLAYFLISTEKLTGRDARYHGLNCAGASLIFLSLLVNWNLPSVIIEGIWIAISLYGLAMALRRKRRNS